MNQEQIHHCMFEWVPALRSGNYQQAKGSLFSYRAYCCLGVACQIYPDVDEVFPSWKIEGTLTNIEVNDYYGLVGGGQLPFPSFSSLPRYLPIEAATEPRVGSTHQNMWRVSLPFLNDTLGYSFDQIADIIDGACLAWNGELKK